MGKELHHRCLSQGLDSWALGGDSQPTTPFKLLGATLVSWRLADMEVCTSTHRHTHTSYPDLVSFQSLGITYYPRADNKHSYHEEYTDPIGSLRVLWLPLQS